MNRIVRTHYPVEKLPVDLRLGLAATGTVTITVQEDELVKPSSSTAEVINQMKVLRDRMPLAEDDPTQRIRRLRDEWED